MAQFFGGQIKGILRVSVDKPIPQVVFYSLNSQGIPQRIQVLKELLDATENISVSWSEKAIALAVADFEVVVRDLQHHLKTTLEIYRQGISMSIAEQTKEILLNAALVEIALGQVQGTTIQTGSTTFGVQTVNALERHGKPFRHLLHFLSGNVLAPMPTHSYYQHIIGMGADQLKREFRRFTAQANELLNYLVDFQKANQESSEESGPIKSKFMK